MTESAAEARKRKILARAEQRMASITFGGTPSADQPATQEPVSKFATNDSITPSESASDNTTVALSGMEEAGEDGATARTKSWVAEQDTPSKLPSRGSSSQNSVQSVAGDSPPRTPLLEQRTASTGLQAALSAQLQPVSSPLQAMEEGPGSAAGSDSDSDDSPRLLHFDIDDHGSPAATPPRKRQVQWAPTPSSPRVAPEVQASPVKDRQAKWTEDADAPARNGRAMPAWSAPRSRTDRVRAAVDATAGVRAVVAALLAVVSVAGLPDLLHGHAHWLTGAYTSFHTGLALRGHWWLPAPEVVQGVPPLALLLGVSLLLMAGSYVVGGAWSRPPPPAGPQPVSVARLLTALLRAAAPRVYAVVAAFLPIKWTLWEDVAVFTFVGALVTVLAGPHFEQHRLWAQAVPLHPLFPHLRRAAGLWSL